MKRMTENRLQNIEVAVTDRVAKKAREKAEQKKAVIISEGWAFRLEDVLRLTEHWRDGRNKDYLRGDVSIAELARQAGIEPYGKPLGGEVTDQEYREMLLEDEECEAKGWTLCFVDDDFHKRMAWYEWQGDKRVLVSELSFLKGFTPEQLAEMERSLRKKQAGYHGFDQGK